MTFVSGNNEEEEEEEERKSSTALRWREDRDSEGIRNDEAAKGARICEARDSRE